ncbi:hypothetical protein V8E55_011758 [Tylopilus felleus]
MDPQAFGSNYAREVAFTEQVWRERVNSPFKRTIVASVTDASHAEELGDVEKKEPGETGEWIGMASIVGPSGLVPSTLAPFEKAGVGSNWEIYALYGMCWSPIGKGMFGMGEDERRRPKVKTMGKWWFCSSTTTTSLGAPCIPEQDSLTWKEFWQRRGKGGQMVLETICIIPTHHKAVKLAPMNGIRGEGRVSIYNTLCWTFTRLSSLPVRTCPQLEVYLREERETSGLMGNMVDVLTFVRVGSRDVISALQDVQLLLRQTLHGQDGFDRPVAAWCQVGQDEGSIPANERASLEVSNTIGDVCTAFVKKASVSGVIVVQAVEESVGEV